MVQVRKNRKPSKPLVFQVGRYVVLSAGIALGASSAWAIEIPENNGWSGSLNVGLSVGTSIRDQAPDSKLYSRADGVRAGLGANGTGATNTDSGNVNYSKGDAFSTLTKASFDFSMKKQDYGFFVRAKAWYDHALEEGQVNQGNGASGYLPVTGRRSLSDAGFDPLARFSGAEILDAYVYTGFEVSGQPGQVRLGRQVINWGESLFIQGINQVNPIDLSALRKPGTEIKDAFLPVESVWANLSLGEGRSLEGFIQTKWAPANIDSCGTYWSPVEFQATHRAGGPCSQAITTLPGLSNYDSIQQGLFVPMGRGKAGDDDGQFGLALRIPSEALDGEVGLYAMRISSRIPYISGRSGSAIRELGALGGTLNPSNFINPIPRQVAGASQALGLTLIPGTGFWEYPGDINVLGVSASTNLAGWSVGAELSHSPNQPAQINGNDLLAGLLYGIGPMRAEAEAAAAAGAGTEIAGYKRLQKTQMQVNGIRVLPRMLGSTQSVLVGEVAYQRANVGDRNTGKRFGRSFIFGFAPHASYLADSQDASLGAAVQQVAGGIGTGNAATNTQEDGRSNDGFATQNSWGYRLRLQLEYPQVFGTSATLFPTFSFAHDVSGYSIDSQIVEGRQTIGLGLRANFNRVHNIELGYVRYADGAKYDAFRDRDYYSLVLSTSF
ncbi:MAG: DUF1302 domain-containing protein [Burkholderiaceae bacterium]